MVTTSPDNADAPIPAGVLAAYGGLALPLAAGFIALQVIVPTFYAQALGLSLSAVGGILLVARLWDRWWASCRIARPPASAVARSGWLPAHR